MREKKTYCVPVVWQMHGHVNVEASSAEEAISIALGPNTPLPEGDYVYDSQMVDDCAEVEEIV